MLAVRKVLPSEDHNVCSSSLSVACSRNRLDIEYVEASRSNLKYLRMHCMYAWVEACLEAELVVSGVGDGHAYLKLRGPLFVLQRLVGLLLHHCAILIRAVDSHSRSELLKQEVRTRNETQQ